MELLTMAVSEIGAHSLLNDALRARGTGRALAKKLGKNPATLCREAIDPNRPDGNGRRSIFDRVIAEFRRLIPADPRLAGEIKTLIDVNYSADFRQMMGSQSFDELSELVDIGTQWVEAMKAHARNDGAGLKKALVRVRTASDRALLVRREVE
jgi:hypothetical protein